MFAATYAYGHLLSSAISLTMAFAFAVSALRVAELRSDVWNAAIYLSLTLVGLIEMRMATGGGLWAARLYLLVFAVIMFLVSAGAHAQYARLVFDADGQRRSRRRLVAYTLLGAASMTGLMTGVFDGGRVHTAALWGAHATVISASWWGALIMGVYAAGNVVINTPVLLAPGPRALERSLVAGSMFGGILFIVWEMLVISGVNPYVPTAGYFATLIGLNGAMVLIERFRNLSQSAGSVGGWVLERRLGGGGMADVYLGHREGTGELRGVVRRAAIKRLRPEYVSNPQFVEMFLDEARVAARLSHPNVVNLYDVGRDRGELYIAMEVVDGASLSHVFQMLRHRNERLPTDALVELGLQLCDALEYVHGVTDDDGRPLALVHRDVSPQNVLLDRTGVVKLADFGIARSAGRSTHTATGVIKGKFSYMSPEQMRGESYDHRVDLYALGVVLYELATGQRLYEAVSEQALLTRVVKGEPPSLQKLDDVFPPLADVLRRALAFAVEERAARATELRALLHALRNDDRGRKTLARLVDEARSWQESFERVSSIDATPAIARPPAAKAAGQ
jgi:serine/threonine-protein kinase